MRLLAGGLVAAAVAILDQLSKLGVLRSFGETGCATHQRRVTSFFDLIITCNQGVSFGLFNRDAGVNAVLFSLLAAAIVAILVYWLARAATPLLAVAIGLIIGGALGNIADRLRLGGVVDFLYFHAGSWYWPAFNVADSAICIGVAAMLLDGLMVRRAGSRETGR